MVAEIDGFRTLMVRAESEYPIWSDKNEYCVLWASNLRSNPLYLPVGHPDRTFPEKESMFMPEEYLVIRYSDDTSSGKKTELYRGTDKKEARRIFDDCTADYNRPHGGLRTGAGRPIELEEAKLISFDCPKPLAEKLEVKARRVGKKKAALIREFIEKGLE